MLWEALDIDRNRINATMSSTEKVGRSYYVLEGLFMEVCEAEREFQEP